MGFNSLLFIRREIEYKGNSVCESKIVESDKFLNVRATDAGFLESLVKA